MTKKGFTIIELLVVITIIAIVASLGLVSFSQARARSRDDRRIADLKTIQSALESYRLNLERSGNASGSYAYPRRYAEGTRLVGDGVDSQNQPMIGIYSNSAFAKVLAGTPVSPQEDRPYIYFAPACFRPGNGTVAQPMIISPAKDGAFKTTKEVTSASVDQYCPRGSGWLPYAVYALLERPRSTALEKTNLVNLASSTDRAVVYSSQQPIYHPEVYDSQGNFLATFDYIANLSKCYPALNASCPDGFSDPDQSGGVPGNNQPLNQSSANLNTSTSPQPSPASSGGSYSPTPSTNVQTSPTPFFNPTPSYSATPNPEPSNPNVNGIFQ